MSLGMYIILDIIKFDLLRSTPETSFSALAPDQQTTFLLWTLAIFGSMLLVVAGTMVWSYRDRIKQLPVGEMLAIMGIALTVCFSFVVVEEVSHVEAPESTETVQPAEPGEEAEAGITSSISWTPMIAVWIVAVGGFVFLVAVRRKEDVGGDEKDKMGRGFWGTMDLFPEFDLIVVIGTLILPWATALVLI